MFLPWKDDNPTRRIPWVTGILIAVNTAVFAWELSVVSPDHMLARWGVVPSRLLGGEGAGPGGAVTLATSLFLHGSFLHLASNLLYLWIFGNNIEDLLGPVRFLLFYAIVGFGGHVAHVLTNAGSSVPTVGASGAIAGVLGAYLLRYPGARVHTFIYLIFLVGTFRIPAAAIIGFWLVIQVVGGVAQFGAVGGGGTAWFEHLGGFATGIAVFRWLHPGKSWRVRVP